MGAVRAAWLSNPNTIWGGGIWSLDPVVTANQHMSWLVRIICCTFTDHDSEAFVNIHTL